MDVFIQKQNQIAPVAIRRVGYAPYINKEGEQSFVRRIHGTDFPRFHLYIKAEDDEVLRCSIHLDQKRPSYQGAHAHGGDYDSETVADEARRIGEIA
ncbi:MAG: hypothetical protein HY422_01435 [Candidatus Komeilibacteria bacterium]|nr:hypothetical protein [Candidatus Komeilibacteria bacterium]